MWGCQLVGGFFFACGVLRDIFLEGIVEYGERGGGAVPCGGDCFWSIGFFILLVVRAGTQWVDKGRWMGSFGHVSYGIPGAWNFAVFCWLLCVRVSYRLYNCASKHI